MKVIKLAVISFVFLFLLITGISLFIPSHVRISKAIQVSAPQEKVLEQIGNVTNWKNWFPGMDSASLFFEDGLATGVVLNKDQRTLVLRETKADEVVAEYRGIKQKSVKSGWQLIPDSSGSVTIQWYMDFRLRWYPWEKFSSILFEKQYGPQMEEGLSRLKTVVENK